MCSVGGLDESGHQVSGCRQGAAPCDRSGAAANSDDAAAGRVERRLAAILAADVAGYSRLVGADEQGTLARWRAHWDELIEPVIHEHHGRVVRITGDGILAEFASVVNAVRCAVAFQRGMAERNADIAPDQRIAFRIGLNVGDVIIDRGDMWGEGVNVAARLEALAEPGGLCVSGRVQDEVAHKLDIVFEDMGERQLKNIARPVQVYRARLPGARSPACRRCWTRHRSSPSAVPRRGATIDFLSRSDNDVASRSDHQAVTAVDQDASQRSARNLLLLSAVAALGSLLTAVAWWTSPSPTGLATGSLAPVSEIAASAERFKAAAPSIIALPFVNLSGDAKQDYLADGITDSLTSDLARALPGILVVSRDTAFTYKGRGVDARQIGRELEVRYLLEGSVLLEGERVRVNTRLVETKEGSQLWAERFDAERKSILQVQDEIVGRVSRAIGLQVVDIEARRSWRERPGSAELIDLVLRGRAVLNLPSSPATMIEARALFEQALKVEPTNVDGLAGVATTLVFEFLNGYYDTGATSGCAGGAAARSRARDRAAPPYGVEGEGRAAARAGQSSTTPSRPPKRSSRKIPASRGPTRRSACRPCISAGRNKRSTGSPRPIASARAIRGGGPGSTVAGTLSFFSGATRRLSAR